MFRAVIALFQFVGFLFVTSLFVFVLVAPNIVAFLVDGIFANVNEPLQPEPPPTSYAIPYSSSDVQVLGGKGRGLSCSIPSVLDWLVFRRGNDTEPISLKMRQACITHDYCYRHGAATYGYSQEDCDYALLDEAQRLCWFVAGGTEFDQQKCRTEAKKVLLGVRLGGNASFARIDVPENKFISQKDEVVADEVSSSTYFEYAPYPYKSQSYYSYRIAELPAHCDARAVRDKGLYSFHVRPSGVSVNVYRKRGLQLTKCASFTIPGFPGRLTFAPKVIKRLSATGASEEWFVWWIRGNMESTHGRFVAIAPRRACIADWQKTFPGFKIYFPSNSPTNRLCNGAQNLPTVFSGPATFTAQTGKATPLENNANEFHNAPGLETDGLRLVAMRVHSCDGREGHNPLCYNDFVLKPNHGIRQVHEPLKVKDQQNDLGEGSDKRRYRNLASAPMIVAGTDKRPVVTWLRRGETDLGQNYGNHAQVRRQRCVPSETKCEQKHLSELTSESVGVFRLANFMEAAEPVLLLGRTTTNPSLVSFQADNQSDKVKPFYWTYPSQLHDGDKQRTGDAVSSSRKEFQGVCNDELDKSWLIRPPALYVNGGQTGVVIFSRVRVDSGESVFMEVLKGEFDTSGTCSLANEKIEVPIRSAYGDTVSQKIESLRKVPSIIVNDENFGMVELIIPNVHSISESIVLNLR